MKYNFPQAERVHAYARAVVAGRIVAGRHVVAACARHLDDLTHGHRRGLVWKPERAESALSFFEETLFLEAGRPFRLEEFQAFIVGSVFGWYRKDDDTGELRRRFRTLYAEMGKGNGKALALDTPIPTASGWTTMGEVSVGDTLFDEHGKTCRVQAVHRVMTGHQCYRVSFSDGAEIVADVAHLWRTWPRRSGTKRGPKAAAAPRKGGSQIFTTGEIAATLAVPASTSRHPQARWNHRVEIAGPLDLPPVPVPLPPYALGVWLGDGDSADARLTCTEQGILDRLHEVGVVATRRASLGRAARYHLSLADGRNFQGTLRLAGLLNAKHIPPAYLRGSYAQRMALLQGLMDTDGYVGTINAGMCEYSTTRRALADGVTALLRTLGFKVSVSHGRARLYGRDVGEKWRISFTAYADEQVFGLARKQTLLPRRKRGRALARSRMIVAVTPVPSVPVRCIAVNSPSRLFLVGPHLVPTHNTPLAAGIGLYGLTLDREDAPEIYAAAVAKDQAKICFKDAKRMVRASPELLQRVTVLTHNLSVPGRSASFTVLSSEDKGHHGLRVHMGLLDEIHAHASAAVVDVVDAGTKNCRNSLIVLITNSGSSRLGPCWAYHNRALDMLAGKPDDSLFAYVCTLDPCPACAARGKKQVDLKCRKCDDWRDLGLLAKANPGLGTILDRDYVRSRIALAQRMPSKLNNVLQLNCCLWTESSNGWLDMHAWRHLCLDPKLKLADFKGRRCWIGMDAANRVDATTVAILFEMEPGGAALDPATLPAAAKEALREAHPGPENRIQATDEATESPSSVLRPLSSAGYALFLRTYVPRDMVNNQSQANHEAYSLWARTGPENLPVVAPTKAAASKAREAAGAELGTNPGPGAPGNGAWLTVTDGAITDFDRIKADLLDFAQEHTIVRLQADPRELGYLLQHLGAELGEEVVAQVQQGPVMISQPMKYFEGLVAAGLMKHDGNPVLDWMLGNVEQKTTRTGGPVKYYYPVKPSADKKIDAAPAAFMALDGALRVPAAPAEPGMVVLG